MVVEVLLVNKKNLFININNLYLHMKILNWIHLIIVIFPFFIFIIPPKFMKRIVEWILLFYILTPVHWIFFDNKCVLTMLTQILGSLEETEEGAEFSNIYLRWLYEPILNIFGLEWNIHNIGIAAVSHAFINILLIWIYCFFYVYTK